MLKATRRQRTLARSAEVRGIGFFHGQDVTLRFHPAEGNSGIIFRRIDVNGSPSVPAHIDFVVPSQRRTAIERGDAKVELIEHVMAALAGMQIDNCLIDIDGPECPGCDGSSAAFVEAFDQAGVVEQNEDRHALVVDETISIAESGIALMAHPPASPGRLTLSYHLDYGPDAPIRPQSYCVGIAPDTFRNDVGPSRTFLLETEADILRAAGIGARASESDLLIFGKTGVIGNKLRFTDECARHKVLDMVGDLALLGMDIHGFIVAHKSGHQTNAALTRRLHERVQKSRRQANTPASPTSLINLDIEAVMKMLPHRYPFLLVDRVLYLEPGERAVSIKNVSVNEPFFRGHWPGMPIMPGVLIVEALAQTAGLLIASSARAAGRVALIASIDGVKLRRPVVPGDQLRMQVLAQRIRSNAASVTGTAMVGDSLAAEAKLRFVMVNAKQVGAQMESSSSMKCNCDRLVS